MPQEKKGETRLVRETAILTTFHFRLKGSKSISKKGQKKEERKNPFPLSFFGEKRTNKDYPTERKRGVEKGKRGKRIVTKYFLFF